MNNKITILGTIKNIKYEHEGYYILHITREDEQLSKYKYKFNNNYFVCKGNSLYKLKIGNKIEIKGKILPNHQKSNIELFLFEFEEVFKSYIETKEGFINYLISFSGIGPKMAEKIALLYSMDLKNCLENFENDIKDKNEVLLNILKKKYDIIKKEVIDFGKDDFDLNKSEKLFIKEMKIRNSTVSKIKKHNKESNIIKIFETNPYEQSLYVKGIGFKTIDQQAYEVKVKLDIPDEIFQKSRFIGGINYALLKAAEGGHSFLRKMGLYHYLEKELDISNINEDIVEKALQELIVKDIIYCEENDILSKERLKESHYRYYLAKNYENEISIANIIKQRVEFSDIKSNLKPENFEFGEFKPSELQSKAIQMALIKNTFILTGGPGTGKTSIAKYIYVNLMKDNPSLKIKIMAPTGTAAKRISNVINATATTIHRGLKLKGMFTEFFHNFDADIVIIDEASMINNDLGEIILKSLKYDTKLIFIGDVDQLEAVGVGTFLEDLIQSNIVPFLKLDKVFRQALKNPIVKFSYDINNGISNTYNKWKVSDCNYNNKLNILMKKSYNKNVNEFYSDNMQDDIITEGVEMYQRNNLLEAQVLLPIKKGGKGSGNFVNQKIQSILNDNDFLEEGLLFKVGDKVIQKRNNYDKQTFNGTLGIIKSYDKLNDKVIVSFIDGSDFCDVVFSIKETNLNSNLLKNIELAYVITIHKSQGQEYKEIVLGLNNFFFINRKLFFTGLTRAREHAIIIGNIQNIKHAIDTVGNKETVNGKLRVVKRNSTLKDRLLVK